MSFHVEPARVPRDEKSPLLVIGLGGTGNDALLHIMHKFKHRFVLPKDANGEELDKPVRTAYLGIDTDPALQTTRFGDVGFDTTNSSILSVQDMVNKIENHALMSDYVKEWWDTRVNGFAAATGAGGIRQVGRLMLFENVNMLVNKITTLIRGILAVDGAATTGDLDIILTTGIAGGTGSGTFLDMAYLLRYVMTTHFPAVNYSIMAFVLLPSVNIDKRGVLSDAQRKLLQTTGFAALKELDFWMNYENHKHHYVQRYSANISVTWTRPFDDVVLLDNCREDGSIIQNAYDTVMDILSEAVLNFFSGEQRKANEPTSFHSHRVNVTTQAGVMNKPFPVNYTYMAVGAASSNAKRDEMITYEGKLVFDDIQALRERPSIIGSREADTFIGRIFPDQNYFGDFAAEITLPGFFTDSVTWPRKTIMETTGANAFHNDPFNSFSYDTNLTAKEFAEKMIEELRERFVTTVKAYLQDAAFGPFRVLEFLEHPQFGFLPTMNNHVTFWQGQVDAINNEVVTLTNSIRDQHYPHMLRGGAGQAIAHAAGSWRDVDDYVDACRRLYECKRDYLFAYYFHEGIKALAKDLRNYITVVLPFFCDLLDQTHRELSEQVNVMNQGANAGAADILDFKTLRQLIDARMSALDGTMKTGMMQNILIALADRSFEVRLNNLNAIEGVNDVTTSLMDQIEGFVQQLTSGINAIDMDSLLRLARPNDTDNQLQQYVAGTLFRDLETASKTMLHQRQTMQDNESVPYAYVSIPKDAQQIIASTTIYNNNAINATGNKITAKESEVVDRIYWLNTRNCLPLYRYTHLPMLEDVYSKVRASADVFGLHLVYKPNHTQRGMDNDWSLLPSPVPHVLIGAERPAQVVTQMESIKRILDIALQTGAAQLTTDPLDPSMRVMTIRMRRDGDANQTVEHFKRDVDAIAQNAALTPEAKLAELEALMAAGEDTVIKYKDFAPVFANAMGGLDIKTNPQGRTTAEVEKAKANLELVERAVAQYILYYQHPNTAEALSRQIEMYTYYGDVCKKLRGVVADVNSREEFCRNFMFLFCADTFSYGRADVSFKGLRDVTLSLFKKEALTELEMDLYEICRPLVLLKLLFDDNDSRIDDADRRYLKDRAQKIRDSINDMDEALYDAIKKNAKAFYDEYVDTPQQLIFMRGRMPQSVREENAALVDKLVRDARFISRL